MAAYYAMKIVKELGFPLKKRVRMIIGTDEESNWRCVNHYFEHEEMPTLGFAPDADFPIINAEKGISDFDFVQKKSGQDRTPAEMEVLHFESGKRYNMVPDYARAQIQLAGRATEFANEFTHFMNQQGLESQYNVENQTLLLEVKGISAHGMEPKNGKNAGLFLVEFLSKQPVDSYAQTYFQFVSRYFFNDSRGERFGVAYSDDLSGELTINVGKLRYTKADGGRLGLNLRYPVTNKMEDTKARLEERLTDEGFTLENFTDSKPHHVDEKDFLIQTLKKVYEEQTGEPAKLLAIGGGTYARSLKSAVAFGPLFPGRPDIAHQKDEYIVIEDLLKATAIYAQAIYELACAD